MHYLAVMIFKVMLQGSLTFYTLPADTLFETQAQCESYINSSDIKPEIEGSVKLITAQGGRVLSLSNVGCMSIEGTPL